MYGNVGIATVGSILGKSLPKSGWGLVGGMLM